MIYSANKMIAITCAWRVRVLRRVYFACWGDVHF